MERIRRRDYTYEEARARHEMLTWLELDGATHYGNRSIKELK